ncbi:hypothetical protein CF392_15330 [Tamilnaduibacter salinus]|uniref:Iron(II)-dependent oxidoreductase n=1 Tax=Tamilnaduibacter salinus TaxID=1484056 RepID=A0A2A2HYS7_9GAMM|nr:selenoneine synthase SenA [Tamilnaduibacter salinus]PAV24621.1 hypothetical protein CF392_15330 [Tamilnaduibacter salinus]
MDKTQLIQQLNDLRARALELVDTLGERALDVPYDPGINPPLWEMGHAAFFYEVFVFNLLDGAPSYDPSMDDLWDSFHVAHGDRWSRELFPGREATRQYFNTIYDRMQARIEREPLSEEARYLYRYAIAHQTMHLESMTWCRQTVGYPAPPWFGHQTPSAEPVESDDVTVPAGTYRIGMPADSPDYGGHDFSFDNEKPGFDLEMPAFRISRTLVRNSDFLRFVEAGGYENPDYWSFGGRTWLASHQQAPRHPLYWSQGDDGWYERLFDGWHRLNPDYPVTHVSYWEAEAWANWAGRRLPTEYEWEVAALGNVPDAPFRRFPWGDAMEAGCADLDGHFMAQLPVSALSKGDSPFGCRQMVGTAWEWTRNEFLPYDGFKVDMYPFMSTLQFGDHKVTKGGGCATASLLIRGTYRQAYAPGRRDVYTGFRTCAVDD